MIVWTHKTMKRLFELYEQHIDRLQQDVAVANLSLGSSDPKKTRLERLTRPQFEAMLADETNEKEAIQLWVRRIIRGHENEFSVRQAAG